MKIFKGTEKIEKHWVIRLVDNDEGNVSIIAADSITGEEITHLIEFNKEGDVIISKNVVRCLWEKGYDAREHDNAWDDGQHLVIKKGGIFNAQC